MERIKGWIAEALMALVVVVSFGFGLLALGAALAVGLVIALAVRLAGPHLLAEAERRASDFRAQAARQADLEAGKEEGAEAAHA